MDRQRRHKQTNPTQPNANFSTFTFLPLTIPTANKKVKELKFPTHNPNATALSTVCILIYTFFVLYLIIFLDSIQPYKKIFLQFFQSIKNRLLSFTGKTKTIMKTILTCLLLMLCSSALLAQKNDTIVKAKKKQLFIGINADLGLGWRNYKPISDTLLLNKLFPNTEKPGVAYSVNLSGGLIYKRSVFSFGFEYSFAEYQNSSDNNYKLIVQKYYQVYDTIVVSNFNYKFTHRFISIPLDYQCMLGAKKVWKLETLLKIGFIIDYYKNVESSLTPKRKVDLDKNYPVLAFGLGIGRKLLETNKMIFSANFKVSCTSTVGSKIKILGTPYESVYYQSKPHQLIIPLISFNLQRKL